MIPVELTVGQNTRRFHLLLNLENGRKVGKELAPLKKAQSEIDVHEGGVRIGEHHGVETVERCSAVVAGSPGHHQHVRCLRRIRRDSPRVHTIRNLHILLPKVGVTIGLDANQRVEGNRVADIVVVEG